MIVNDSVPPPVCRRCGAQTPPYARPKRKRHYAIFCSKECHHLWRADRWAGNKLRQGLVPVNAIPPGTEPWNKGVTGIHLSPATEFKPGHSGTRRLPVGAVTQRADKNGTVRAWVKIAEPNRWVLRAVKVYCDTYGKVPRSHVVHHKDRNSLNDDPRNLEALTRSQHINVHRDDLRAIARPQPSLFGDEGAGQ